jgi:hypothetical protein
MELTKCKFVLYSLWRFGRGVAVFTAALRALPPPFLVS